MLEMSLADKKPKVGAQASFRVVIGIEIQHGGAAFLFWYKHQFQH